MSDSLFRKLIIVFVTLSILASIVLSTIIFILRSEIDLGYLLPCMLTIENYGCPEGDNLIIWLPNIFFLGSVTILFTIISTKYGTTIKYRIGVWVSLLLLVSLCIFLLIFTTWGAFYLGFPLSLIIASIYFIIYQERPVIKFSVLLGLLISSFILKRQDFSGGSQVIVGVSGVFSTGLIMLAIKSIVTIQKNRYLSIVMFICLIILSVIITGIMLKWQRWPGGDLLMNCGSILMIVVSLIVLLTLPNSGFIKWSKHHKDILLKTLVLPWVFFLVFTSFRYLLPDKTYLKIFYSDATTDIRFNMNDYPIDNQKGQE